MFMLRHSNDSEKLRWVLELAGEEFHEVSDPRVREPRCFFFIGL